MSSILQQWDKQYLWHPFTPMHLWLQEDPLIIERGQGVFLYDNEGNRYVDGVSSLWCNVHGHNHPHINAAIKVQLDKIAHSTLLGLANEPSIALAKRLIEKAGGGLQRVFYSDSGATAVEIALKIAFQYYLNHGDKARTHFVALKQSYHGDTIGSVSVGGIEIFHQIFGPLTFQAYFADAPHPYRCTEFPSECRQRCLNQMDALLQSHAGRIAAIIVEPLVQGAAGIQVHPEGFLAGVQKLAREHDVLLICDEVATGFGRTGTMFACAQESVTPDIMCLAKGITGGYLPLAATLTTERVFDAFLREPMARTTFYHGHTYTGNALACAAALASLELFETEDTLAQLPAKISLIDQALSRISNLEYVGNVRQKGMMAGIELVEDKERKQPFAVQRRIAARVCRALRHHGVILRPLGDTIVVMPPLAIADDVLGSMLDTVEMVLRDELPSIAC